MYMPPQFNVTDRAVAARLMRDHPFATLISNDDQGLPYVTHLPLVLEERGPDDFVLWGHCAKPNAQWRYLQARPRALVSFLGPHAYLSPDVVLDMGTIELDDLGGDRVRLRGATGRPRPAALKVVGGFPDGHKAEVTWGFSWPDAWSKAQAAVAMVRAQLADRRVPHEELFVEFPGLSSAHGALAPAPDNADELNEVWVRLVLRTREKAAADGFGRLFPWMGLSGPAYTCGFHGLHNTGELLGIWPTLIERDEVERDVRIAIIET